MSLLAIGLLCAITVGCTLYLGFHALFSADAQAQRRQRLFMQPGMKLDRRTVVNRRDQVAKSLKDIDNRQKAKGKVTLEARLDQAGLTIKVKQYYLLSCISGILVGALLYIKVENVLVLLLGLIAGGIGLPLFIVQFIRKRRFAAFIKGFPDALDIIARGLKTGLPLNDCMRTISAEGTEPVKSEFRYIVEAQALGMSLSEAIARITSRVPIPETNFFVIAVQIQQKAGGNLAEVVSNLSRLIRDRRKMKDKVQAMSSEARASAMIIGAMPLVLTGALYFVDTATISLLWTTETGQKGLLAGAFSYAMGIFVMRKMINFET